MIKCCQTQVENEYQVIESEIDRLNTEIQLKGSLIKELEMKISRLEVSLEDHINSLVRFVLRILMCPNYLLLINASVEDFNLLRTR